MEDTYKGYAIKYDESKKTFIARIGNSDYNNPDLPTVRKYIDRLESKDFKRVDVIVEDGRKMSDAVVTSYPEEQSKYCRVCWVSFKDKGQHHSRSKVSIAQVFLDNPHNREILAQMKERESAIEMLQTEIRGLKDTLETYNPDV